MILKPDKGRGIDLGLRSQLNFKKPCDHLWQGVNLP